MGIGDTINGTSRQALQAEESELGAFPLEMYLEGQKLGAEPLSPPPGRQPVKGNTVSFLGK